MTPEETGYKINEKFKSHTDVLKTPVAELMMSHGLQDNDEFLEHLVKVLQAVHIIGYNDGLEEASRVFGSG